MTLQGVHKKLDINDWLVGYMCLVLKQVSIAFVEAISFDFGTIVRGNGSLDWLVVLSISI